MLSLNDSPDCVLPEPKSETGDSDGLTESSLSASEESEIGALTRFSPLA